MMQDRKCVISVKIRQAGRIKDVGNTRQRRNHSKVMVIFVVDCCKLRANTISNLGYTFMFAIQSKGLAATSCLPRFDHENRQLELSCTALWMKTTCRHRETFVVAGLAQRAGKFDGLYLGRREAGRLVYAGKLERGFSEMDRMRIAVMFEKLKTKEQPITASRRFPKAQWVQPRVLVDAEFRGKTGEGLLRHPSFKGVRRDLME